MTLNNDTELSTKHYQQGLEFYAQGQYKEAIKEHTQAINLNPSNLDALLDRSNAYCQIGKFKKAIENLNEQSLLLSNDAYYHHILGSAYFGLEEHDCALSYFNQST
ncbi:tetratricopeptide repeat protein [Phormidium tenue]|uniref:Tetratricopeptide repeat protein n=1 Tax=Phormidium tenue FACHB-1050 TaxID=2692857 RepID=A0ABR8C8H3_9CYAN|nr:tetratricopeptide repeat protein [Phormidium tenue]MBD2316989.1 tetratricopeptide repeat protein [Phormidium tenue FACHB-1050]